MRGAGTPCLLRLQASKDKGQSLSRVGGAGSLMNSKEGFREENGVTLASVWGQAKLPSPLP